MKHIVLIVMLLGLVNGFAQPLTVPLKGGSDGSDGPLVVTETVWLNMPADGVFNFTTIRVASFGHLHFRRNAQNTPVYLLATGDVVVENSGSINVEGGARDPEVDYSLIDLDQQPGPGGFAGGAAGLGAVAPGPGQGPGGGLPKESIPGAEEAGDGNYSFDGDRSNPADGAFYGNPTLIPLIGGSGGAGAGEDEGGGGGGAILIASATRIVVENGGWVTAEGEVGGGDAAEGSGGAIRLVAPIVEGAGRLDYSSWSSGFSGRLRIDAIDHQGVKFGYDGSSAARSFGSNLIVFPDIIPSLDILNAAGQTIAEGTQGPVTVTLPPGASEAQTIVLQARDFEDIVNVEVVLIPDSGDRLVFEAQIDNRNNNPAVVSVPVQVPANTRTHVHAWTR